jgi:hypothetical protein
MNEITSSFGGVDAVWLNSMARVSREGILKNGANRLRVLGRLVAAAKDLEECLSRAVFVDQQMSKMVQGCKDIPRDIVAGPINFVKF